MERHIGVTGQSILAHCVTTQTKCWPILLLTIVTLTVYSAIGITLSSVSLCPSVRPSVTLCTVALGVGVGVESCAIVFLGWYFSFTSSDTFAVRLFTFQRFIHCCRMQPIVQSQQSEKPNRRNVRVRNSHCYSRLGIFSGSVLQLSVRSAFQRQLRFLFKEPCSPAQYGGPKNSSMAFSNSKQYGVRDPGRCWRSVCSLCCSASSELVSVSTGVARTPTGVRIGGLGPQAG